ncbi:hypothetical protein BT96DRAFT_838445 [Gymnopus androsaceus JB14]|uniref:Uncharacterized protein n=1 Tax=Gymnopus androsaceus JB14 TaxID=1447944 RepID=A0A6A4GN83_9AGAR|nr:hypothetical protein BT96DRAFT_838445 [Gymnopus androsaceus JB14]
MSILALSSPNALKVSSPILDKSLVTPPLSSAAKNTPTKLHCFLEHAEEDLGVANATLLHYQIEDKGYGLDILHQVLDDDLKELGVKLGDILHLKRTVPLWFNGPDAEQEHLASGSTSRASGVSDIPAMYTHFEKQWPDGGHASTFTPGPNEEPHCSFDWYYFSELTKSMIPVPSGFVPVMDGEQDEFGNPSASYD